MLHVAFLALRTPLEAMVKGQLSDHHADTVHQMSAAAVHCWQKWMVAWHCILTLAQGHLHMLLPPGSLPSRLRLNHD